MQYGGAPRVECTLKGPPGFAEAKQPGVIDDSHPVEINGSAPPDPKYGCVHRELPARTGQLNRATFGGLLTAKP
jgi:hypothetical protein